VKPQNIHFHFGAGKLGIGAVLPTFASDLNLVVVQLARDSGKASDSENKINWDSIGRQKRVLLYNNNGINVQGVETPPYRKWFRCLRKTWDDGDIVEDDLSTSPRQPLLIVVDHYSQVGSVLKFATRLSCSLGGGQSALGEMLTECHPANPRVYILAFENTIEGKLKGFCERTQKNTPNSCIDWLLYPVITDRICSERKSLEGEHSVWVECEEHLKVIAPAIAEDCFDPYLIGKNKPVNIVPPEDLPFHIWRKRGLVNSLHQLLALFCLRALSERRIPTGGQYLPLVMVWFAKEYPHLHHSVQLYARLRALELVWPMFQVIPSEGAKEEARQHVAAAKRYYGVKQPQQLYDILGKEADEAIGRFQKASDELKRLINPENLRKELKKFDEHVLKPARFARLNEKGIISRCLLYDKPNAADLRALEGVLSESFLIAMDEVMGLPKRQSK
jgi:hypothetical protein